LNLLPGRLPRDVRPPTVDRTVARRNGTQAEAADHRVGPDSNFDARPALASLYTPSGVLGTLQAPQELLGSTGTKASQQNQKVTPPPRPSRRPQRREMCCFQPWVMVWSCLLLTTDYSARARDSLLSWAARHGVTSVHLGEDASKLIVNL
jgi:hypothetical protein